MQIILVLIASLLASLHAAGQQPFNPVVYSNWSSTPVNQFTSIPAAPGVFFSQFSRGSGNQFSTAADGINSGKWNNATPAEAITANRFFTFSVSSNNVSTVNIDSLKFVFGRNNSGPDSCVIQYKGPSTGYNFTGVVNNGFQIFAPSVSATTPITVVPAAPLTITPGDSIVFRIVAWGASGILGTLKIMNGTQVFGSVSATPSNSIHALIVLTTDLLCVTTNSSDSIRVSYTTTGAFNAGNIYSLELSDNNGNFTSPTVVGTLNDISNAGEIEGWIPAGISAGNYRLRISSSDPVIIGLDTTEISIHPGFFINAALTQPLCDPETGSIDLTLSGGTAPFIYNWSNTATSQDLQDLEDGEYTVVISDAMGCSADSLFAIDAVDPIQIATVISDLTCHNTADGSIGLTISGGTAPYTYAWNNSTETTPVLDNLAAGVYSVTVTDDNGCTISDGFTLSAPAILVLTESITHALCNDSANGMITVSVSGGTAPYTYGWDNSTETTPALDNLAAGAYSVTITDANECTLSASFTINEPTALVVTETIANATCANCQGMITLNVNGGTAPYSYDWDGSPTTPVFSGIPGNYCVEITDNNGCQLEECYQILSTAGLDETGSYNAVSVFPNPSGGNGFVSFKGGGSATKGSVEVIDLHGKKIGNFVAGSQEVFLSLDVFSWEDGIYFFRLISDGGFLIETGRFVISH